MLSGGDLGAFDDMLKKLFRMQSRDADDWDNSDNDIT